MFKISLIKLIYLMICIKNSSVYTAIDIRYNNRLNGINDKSFEFTNKLDKSPKCEIRITTNGVCSVDSHVIKPKIIVKNYSKVKYNPVFKSPKTDDMFRNMNTFNFEEERANDLIDQFLNQFKQQFSQEIDPMLIDEFGNFDISDHGSVKVYDLRIKGISNIQRHGSVGLHANSQMKLWSINTNFSIDDITADFKVDAKFNRVSLNGWALQVLIKQCILTAILEFNQMSNVLTISSLIVKSIEGFRLNTDNLSWPFNHVVAQVLDRQMSKLKDIITSNSQKYFSETLKSFDVSKVINKMNYKMN